jgi:hypothetical protein
MYVREERIQVSTGSRLDDLLAKLATEVESRLGSTQQAVRFAVSDSTGKNLECELGILVNADPPIPSIFAFRRRLLQRTTAFNVILLVPTGIGAEFGGHAGDAAPIAQLLAGACDTLITHPNVVNASDLNEIPSNALYVEGSVITTLIMGTVGLMQTRANRILLALDSDPGAFVNGAINAAGAARASMGVDCCRVAMIPPRFRMRAYYSSSGSAMGEIDGLDAVAELLARYRGEFDALAICSYIQVPPSLYAEYFNSGGSMVNPWGGVEAMLTHSISSLYNIPSAHSPISMIEHISAQIGQSVVDCRMAAESTSLTYLHCILKGLHRSPRIVTDREAMRLPGVVTAEDISCLVIPDGCIGLPTLAALEQGIPVIAVKANHNIMKNDLTRLPWAKDQLQVADNYLEAAGLLVAMRQGVALASTRRPLAGPEVSGMGKGSRIAELAEVS